MYACFFFLYDALTHFFKLTKINLSQTSDFCDPLHTHSSQQHSARVSTHSLGGPEAVFLVAGLNVGTIFEVTFQHVRAQNMSFWPVESEF